ncbi:beta-galactosidase trimerization domain-containing protein, partial [bacterium]|nr:beta-galactosidase trimerization domain-containing protein [bacterium]
MNDLIREVKNYAIETRGREILFTGFPLDFLVPSNYSQFALYDFVTPISSRAWRGGFPPLGRSIHWYKMFYASSGKPAALGPQDTEAEIFVLSTYDAQNLKKLQFAEAVANQGSISPKAGLGHPDWLGTEKDIELGFTLYPKTLREYSTFLRENIALFDSEAIQSLAEIGLVYSLPSLAYDKLAHIDSWEGTANLLAHLHIPYDVVFFGDGINLDDTITFDTLNQYPLVILPHILALTENQEGAILEYLEAGGKLIIYGALGEVDENQLAVERTALTEFLEQNSQDVYRFPESTVGNEYYRYVAYNEIAAQYGEAPESRISEDRAVQIREEMEAILAEMFSEMLIDTALPLHVGIEPYLVNNTLIIH